MNSFEKQIEIQLEIIKRSPTDKQMSFILFDGKISHIEVIETLSENPSGKPSFCSVIGKNILDGTHININLENVNSIQPYLSSEEKFVVLTYKEINELFGIASSTAYLADTEMGRGQGVARAMEIKKIYRDFAFTEDEAIKKIKVSF
jgi:hypothetical protein